MDEDQSMTISSQLSFEANMQKFHWSIPPPTEAATDKDKKTFYGQLKNVLKSIPRYDIKMVWGNFNV